MPSDSFNDHGERRDARRARSTETLSAIGAASVMTSLGAPE